MTTAQSPIRKRIPPLENGDRLTRAEFERRFDAMPGLKKAELIKGVVYMPAAVRAAEHGDPHTQVLTWLGYYWTVTPGIRVSTDASVRLGESNMPQPDAAVRIPTAAGGQCWVDQNGYLRGAPELAVEVAASSTSLDLHDKLEVYREHGVGEYVVWRVLDGAFDWFVLREGDYQRIEPVEDSGGGRRVFKSVRLPGLWLDPDAMLRGDLARVLDVVREGGSSAEHDAFVRRLSEAGESSD